MQVRALVGVNAVLAIVLSMFVWAMLPFAQGVRCDAAGLTCPPVSFSYHVTFAAIPALLVLAVTWLGVALFRRSRLAGYVTLALCPVSLVSWVALVWSGHVP